MGARGLAVLLTVSVATGQPGKGGHFPATRRHAYIVARPLDSEDAEDYSPSTRHLTGLSVSCMRKRCRRNVPYSDSALVIADNQCDSNPTDPYPKPRTNYPACPL